jgi:error-prone DNA polymerase
MATFKRNGDIHKFREKFISGMIDNGYPPDFATRCFNQIEGFGTYGFPESHAASFALLVYVSAWIKCFYPEVFACALLNSQPMGFYAPAQIVRDAREHGVEVRPPDVNFSDWDCTLEPYNFSLSAPRGPLGGGEGRGEVGDARALAETHLTLPALRAGPLPLPPEGRRGALQYRPALRLGLRQIKGFSEADARKLIEARGAGYRDAGDLWRRSGQGRAALERLAEADALRSLTDGQGGLDRRRSLWALKALGDAPLPLFANRQEKTVPAPHPPAARVPPSPREHGEREGVRGRDMPSLHGSSSSEEETRAASLLPEMPLGEHVVEDYATVGLSLKRHPLAFLRDEFAREGFVTAADLATLPVDRRLAIAGLVLIRQRPGSANGVVFVTLEDETGIANLIVWPNVLERFRRAALGATLLHCRGRLQREQSVIHIVAEELRDLTARLNTVRERTGNPLGDPAPPGAAKPPLPGHGRQDLVIVSRDFR